MSRKSTIQQSHVLIRIGELELYFGWQEDKALNQNMLWHNGGTFCTISYLAINKEQGRRCRIIIQLLF